MPFSVRNTKICKICKFYRVVYIFHIFFNVARSKFAFLLVFKMLFIGAVMDLILLTALRVEEFSRSTIAIETFSNIYQGNLEQQEVSLNYNDQLGHSIFLLIRYVMLHHLQPFLKTAQRLFSLFAKSKDFKEIKDLYFRPKICP